jgi:hypothetical protein
VGERAGTGLWRSHHSIRPIMGRFGTYRRKMGHAAMQYSRGYVN